MSTNEILSKRMEYSVNEWNIQSTNGTFSQQIEYSVNERNIQ